MYEREKLLVTSNFFHFSRNVFHSYIYLVRQNAALCGNGLCRFFFAGRPGLFSHFYPNDKF